MKLFLKGMLMGVCDLVPGISGGTIALITGIYERLITAVKGFSVSLIKNLFRFLTGQGKKEFMADVKKLDLIFLITLGGGILASLLIGARVFDYLLHHHFTLTMSFFIGLILASSMLIYPHIERRTVNELVFGVIGAALGVSLAFVVETQRSPTLLYLFFSGFIAISAMFLPGISGSYLLLILGVYTHMLGILKHIFSNLVEALVFIAGAALGAYTISRLISFLFVKSKSTTLALLLGLVLGSLAIPFKRIAQETVWNVGNSGFSLLLLVLGFGIVFFVQKHTS